MHFYRLTVEKFLSKYPSKPLMAWVTLDRYSKRGWRNVPWGIILKNDISSSNQRTHTQTSPPHYGKQLLKTNIIWTRTFPGLLSSVREVCVMLCAFANLKLFLMLKFNTFEWHTFKHQPIKTYLDSNFISDAINVLIQLALSTVNQLVDQLFSLFFVLLVCFLMVVGCSLKDFK